MSLHGLTRESVAGMRSASEPYALLLARTARENLGADWGLSETGAAGPTGNPYGDAAGHTCLAVSGPVEMAITLETGVGRPRGQHGGLRRAPGRWSCSAWRGRAEVRLEAAATSLVLLGRRGGRLARGFQGVGRVDGRLCSQSETTSRWTRAQRMTTPRPSSSVGQSLWKSARQTSLTFGLEAAGHLAGGEQGERWMAIARRCRFMAISP